jgi:CheY-like chemotaxis protein
MALGQMILNSYEVEITEVETGPEAIELIVCCATSTEAQSQPFDLIFIDIEMPELNGWQVTKRLKTLQESGAFQDLCPIIGHSSFTGKRELKA